MSTQTPDAAAVREAVRSVTDPELDRSIVELDYLAEVAVDDGDVTLALVLPTAWCSPAFAWMMATDARDALRDHPATDAVRIELRDHMHAEEVTTGVNEGLSFAEAFDTADGDVAGTRAELDRKARLARQRDAVDALRDAGLSDAQVAALKRDDLTLEDGRATVALDGFYVTLDADPLERYLEKATAVGVGVEPGDRVFADRDGDSLTPEGVEEAQKAARLARTNMGGQGGVCESLHAARNPELAGD
ncbi:iron-sulfur cluster assembly protein [Halocalculus aciditolerans]|uniref:MIP18 family-like domain-containing protein n=1 Tax=Halocalculus aciditolerans TaxID=1383812 RepID=A0A830FC70_9EURY|nr:iron-sulfur cluster assembly protein [Halocalculus aciditolerans]GGL60963.1 hypothetical protein GCM10009039_18910 [Halocalculus aciditolerans]